MGIAKNDMNAKPKGDVFEDEDFDSEVYRIGQEWVEENVYGYRKGRFEEIAI